MNTTITVRHLAPTQTQPWEFVLSTSQTEGGGIVSVPSTMLGYPIDWPPRFPEQVRWVRELAPNMSARAAHAWYLEQRDWKRLCERLSEQLEFEKNV